MYSAHYVSTSKNIPLKEKQSTIESRFDLFVDFREKSGQVASQVTPDQVDFDRRCLKLGSNGVLLFRELERHRK